MVALIRAAGLNSYNFLSLNSFFKGYFLATSGFAAAFAFGDLAALEAALGALMAFGAAGFLAAGVFLAAFWLAGVDAFHGEAAFFEL